MCGADKQNRCISTTAADSAVFEHTCVVETDTEDTSEFNDAWEKWSHNLGYL